jgi:hypothetical protein
LQRERALRFGADRICLWCLCEDRRCRRAKACRGDVRSCAELAESWLAVIDEELRARPDFAAMEREIETPEALRAYRAWRSAIQVSCPRRRASSNPGSRGSASKGR